MADELLWRGGAGDKVEYIRVSRSHTLTPERRYDLGDTAKVVKGKFSDYSGVVIEFTPETLTLECGGAQ